MTDLEIARRNMVQAFDHMAYFQEMGEPVHESIWRARYEFWNAKFIELSA